MSFLASSVAMHAARDRIELDCLAVECIIGVLPTERTTQQRLEIHVSLEVCLCASGASDNLADTVNYAALETALAEHARAARALTLESLAFQLARICLAAGGGRGAGCGGGGSPPRVRAVTVRLAKPAALPLTRAPLVVVRLEDEAEVSTRSLSEQPVTVAEAAVPSVSTPPLVDMASTHSTSMASSVIADLSSPDAEPPPLSLYFSLPLSLEPHVSTVHIALGSNLGDRAENIDRALELLEVGLEPEEEAAAEAGEAAAAPELAEAAGLSLPAQSALLKPRSLQLPAGAYLRVSDTSFLYETPPAYVLDQPAYVNAAAALQTNLSPLTLIAHIKVNVESALGRPLGREAAASAAQPSLLSSPVSQSLELLSPPPRVPARFGPRVVDVDIVLWGARTLRLASGALVVPHPRLAERAFVLGPLSDIAPGAVLPDGSGGGTDVATLLRKLAPPISSLRRVLPLPFRAWARGPSRATALLPVGASVPGARTLVMGVLNATPDSFSDGGALTVVDAGDDRVDVAAALAAAQRLVAAGADIIDIGGQSTRPGAPRVPPAAEAARVLPVLAAVRAWLDATPAAVAVGLSVDTFSAAVASASLAAGANIINDVAAGCLDERMLRTSARARVPYIMMHMRGTPVTMRGLAAYAGTAGAAARAAGEIAQREFREAAIGASDAVLVSTPAPARLDDTAEAAAVVNEVRSVLATRTAAAIAAGARRWYVCVDPGLGFAKATVHNLALLRTPGALTPLRFPCIVGPSRKAFLGELTGRNAPASRVAATGAALAAAVASGADAVRVHDVAEAVDVVRVADAVWRGGVSA